MPPLPFTHGTNVSNQCITKNISSKLNSPLSVTLKKLIISAEKNILHKKYLYCLKIWQLIEKILLK